MRSGLAILAAAAVLAACGNGDDGDESLAAPGFELEEEGVAQSGAAGIDTPAGGAVAANCSQYGALDRDVDGRGAREEYDSFRGGAFADWDLDNDARVSRAEFEQCWAAGDWSGGRQAAFNETAWNEWDDDTDGYLTEQEFFAEDAFATLDADADNALSDGEWPRQD